MQHLWFFSLCLVKKKPERKYYNDEILLKAIGEKIRTIRLSQNMSQESLANNCGIDYSQVNRMELGKVNFGIIYLYKIALVFQIDPKELLP